MVTKLDFAPKEPASLEETGLPESAIEQLILKILYYRNFSQRLGADRPGGAVIIDAVDSSLATTVDFADFKFADVPDVWFQRDYLPHLNVQ